MDVAQLGLEVNSSAVGKATTELQKLTNAARVAEKAVSDLAAKRGAAQSAVAAAKGYQSQSAAALAAARASGTASKEDIKAAQAALEKARAVTASARADLASVNSSLAAARADEQQAAAALKAARAANSANDNIKRMGGGMSGLAAQFQDIGVTAAMGMNPMLIALQQGTQIAGQMEMALQGGATAGGVFMQALRSLISPISLISIGLTALAAALLQMVNWSKLAATALIALADVLETIAPYAVAAAAGLALLYAPAIIGGIVSLIALLGRMAVAAVSAGLAMAAANPAGAFVLGVVAAVAAANIFRDELAQIFGRDIVADAKNAVNFIVGAFVGGFNGIKAAWSALPSAIGDLVYSAANTVIIGTELMVNTVVSKIDQLIGKINASMKSLPFGIGDSISIPTIGTFEFGKIKNPYAGQAMNVGGQVSDAMSSAMGTDYVGGFGEAISRGASAASSKLKELAKDLTTVDEKSKKKGGGGKSEAEKYSDIVDGANRRIASLKAEQAALGLTEQEALKLQYTQDLLNQAQQRGITLTAAQKAELTGLAEQMASTEVATRKAEEALAFAKDATKGFISDLRQGLMNGEGFWASFGKAASNVLDKIIGKIEDELVDALFSAGSATGGGGGLFGSLLGGVGSLFGFADGGYTGRKAANAVAGVVHGGEYVFSKKATDRIGVGNLERMHKGLGGISAPAPANRNSVAPQSIAVQVTGVLVEQNGGVSALIDQRSQAQIGKASPAIVNEANKRVVPTMSMHQMQKAGGDYRLA